MNDKGITLVEIIVVVAVIATLGFLAGPEMLNIGPKAKMKTAARDLKSNLELARMEAAKRNRSAYIVFKTGTCSGEYNDSGSYEVIIDEDNTGGPAGGIKIPLLGMTSKGDNRTRYSLKASTALCKTDALASETEFRFNARGFWVKKDGKIQLGGNTFKISSRYKEEKSQKHPAWMVSVSEAGHISIEYDKKKENDA